MRLSDRFRTIGLRHSGADFVAHFPGGARAHKLSRPADLSAPTGTSDSAEQPAWRNREAFAPRPQLRPGRDWPIATQWNWSFRCAQTLPALTWRNRALPADWNSSTD